MAQIELKASAGDESHAWAKARRVTAAPSGASTEINWRWRSEPRPRVGLKGSGDSASHRSRHDSCFHERINGEPSQLVFEKKRKFPAIVALSVGPILRIVAERVKKPCR